MDTPRLIDRFLSPRSGLGCADWKGQILVLSSSSKAFEPERSPMSEARVSREKKAMERFAPPDAMTQDVDKHAVYEVCKP